MASLKPWFSWTCKSCSLVIKTWDSLGDKYQYNIVSAAGLLNNFVLFYFLCDLDLQNKLFSQRAFDIGNWTVYLLCLEHAGENKCFCPYRLEDGFCRTRHQKIALGFKLVLKGDHLAAVLGHGLSAMCRHTISCHQCFLVCQLQL
jgi:hypothetical protein